MVAAFFIVADKHGTVMTEKTRWRKKKTRHGEEGERRRHGMGKRDQQEKKPRQQQRNIIKPQLCGEEKPREQHYNFILNV